MSKEERFPDSLIAPILIQFVLKNRPHVRENNDDIENKPATISQPFFDCRFVDVLRALLWSPSLPPFSTPSAPLCLGTGKGTNFFLSTINYRILLQLLLVFRMVLYNTLLTLLHCAAYRGHILATSNVPAINYSMNFSFSS